MQQPMAPQHGYPQAPQPPMQYPQQPGHGAQPMGGGAAAAHQITHGPSFAMLRVDVRPGETLIAEAGAMIARHQPVGMEVKLNAGRSAGFFAKLKAIFIAMI